MIEHRKQKWRAWGFCSVKTCGGNFAFDYVRSDSVGNSGGILCVWDPNSFRRSNTTISDYFIMIRGVWLKTSVNLLIVAVYTPYDLRDKRMLWDYLAHVINQWDGADVFNSFIANAGLEEVPLGGSSFTWCYKSATKMSKLDRFLISKNLLITCPNISATTLDRYLSNHRPILLRETQSDYGLVPFGFFHHWTQLEGFNKFYIDTWSEAPGDDSSAMRSMMRKLKYLKEWNIGNKNNTKRAIEKYKEELDALDAAIDKGNGSDDIVNKRIEMDLERDVSKEELKRATIENDVFEAFKHFFTYGDILKGCNSSIIALILKIRDANLVKDFRTISLIGSIYKIIKKILASRLVGVLGDIVNEVQSAFIAERQILDGPFILNEREVDAGMFMGIKLSPSLNLSHMFYVDDAVFVGQWCDGNINTLVHMLECFYRALGLRIIMSKSMIMGVRVKDQKVKYAASKLGVPLSVLCMVESIHSHFFNGHVLRSNKATWVKWNSVLLSREKGGLETFKSVMVSKKLTDSSLDNSFHRKTRGGVELVQYNALWDLVHAVTLVPLFDRWVWSLESLREFSVASVRKVIDEKRISNMTTMTRWIKCVPIKVNVLTWKIKIAALPTRLNISRRGINIDSILCPICDCGVEFSSHLYFSCSLARQVASKIFYGGM
nr:RNA-directed DNA polymerase, eukaryota [Tanacetum cinerariifolium]